MPVRITATNDAIASSVADVDNLVSIRGVYVLMDVVRLSREHGFTTYEELDELDSGMAILDETLDALLRHGLIRIQW